jgi:TolA-binding protein
VEIEVKTLKYIAAFFIILLIVYSQTKTEVITIEKKSRGNILSQDNNEKNSKNIKKQKLSNRTFSEIKQKNKMTIVTRKFIKIDRFSQSGEFENAIEELTKIVNSPTESDPYIKAKAMYELARMYMVMKNFDSANKFFDDFIKKFPGHKQVENAKRALTYMKKYVTYKEEFVGFEKEIKNNK